jgi:hypothetical protein
MRRWILSCSLAFPTLGFSADLFVQNPKVKKEAMGQTPYLHHVRSPSMIIKNNALAVLDSSHPRYSLFQSFLHRPGIRKVARLFAYANYLREIEGNPAKYGEKRGNREQRRLRAQYLSENLQVIFKRDRKEVDRYTKLARKGVDEFHQMVEKQMGSSEVPYTRKDTLYYLKLIEERGFFDKKGPTYVRTFQKTGATQERYHFIWTNVSRKKLARTIATDGFHLMADLKEPSPEAKAEPSEPGQEFILDDGPEAVGSLEKES